MPDWIDDFLAYSQGIPSPPIFQLWAGISTLAAALERRVWVTTARFNIYPNLYVTLVSPPAVGKSIAIDQSSMLCHAASAIARQKFGSHAGFRFAPVDMTSASMIDNLALAKKTYTRETEIIEYASLYAQVSELGVLMPAHELAFVSILNHIYDCPSSYGQSRRSLKDQIDIQKPQLNILAGTQPGFLAATLPEAAFSMGLMSRLLLIYASSGPLVDLFQAFAGDKETFNDLAKRLADTWKLYGRLDFTSDAIALLKDLHTTGIPPVPNHSRLTHYLGRRILTLLKLAQVSCVSRGLDTTIGLFDIERARGWLLAAEDRMPDIFREMSGKSDGQVIEDLHLFVWRNYAKDKKPVHEARLYDFLKTRTPSEKIPRIIEIAVRSNVLTQQKVINGPSYYVPLPTHQHGVE